MEWDAKKHPGVIGPGNFPHWMTEGQRTYYTWLRTADAHALWDKIHNWIHFDGQDTLFELADEMKERGYEVDFARGQGWHVCKDGTRLDDEFRPRI